jgi:hypothetical protein
LQRVERNPHLQTLDELLAGLRRVDPFAYRDVPPPASTAVCTDRTERVKLLAERAVEGDALFDASKTVHLPPDDHHEGRHHRRRRRRPT